MTTPADSTYGLDVACVNDADAFFTTATGLALVRQDAIHRITNDNALGDDSTGSRVIVGWGFDVRKLVGMSASKLAAHQPVLAEVLTRDPRVVSAAVTLTATKDARGNADVLVNAVCVSAFGPFDIIKPVSALTAADFTGAP